MDRPIDNYFLQQAEPTKSCLLFLRSYLLKKHKEIEEKWKYKTPCYCIKGKMISYLWVHKKYKVPYIGIVEGDLVNHPLLIREKTGKMKMLLVDPKEDLPMETIDEVLDIVVALHY